MKRNKILTAIIALMISALALTACGKSEFSGNWEGEKKMSITAEKAAKGDFFMSGSLHVEEGGADRNRCKSDKGIDQGGIIRSACRTER